jgi:hypothetical protein
MAWTLEQLRDWVAANPRNTGEDNSAPDYSVVPAEQRWLAMQMGGPIRHFRYETLLQLGAAYGVPIVTSADVSELMARVSASLAGKAPGTSDVTGMFSVTKENNLARNLIVGLALGGTVAGIAGVFGGAAAAPAAPAATVAASSELTAAEWAASGIFGEPVVAGGGSLISAGTVSAAGGALATAKGVVTPLLGIGQAARKLLAGNNPPPGRAPGVVAAPGTPARSDVIWTVATLAAALFVFKLAMR